MARRREDNLVSSRNDKDIGMSLSRESGRRQGNIGSSVLSWLLCVVNHETIICVLDFTSNEWIFGGGLLAE